MGSIIKQQNERLLREPDNTNPRSCNCLSRDQCPLNGACLTAGVTYAAIVKYVENGAEQENLYNGSTSGPFKNCYSGHLSSFRHKHQEKKTELLNLIWKLKRRGVDYSINWAITKQAQPYKCGSRRCDLCLTEKVIIARCSHPGMINKLTELLAKCRHRNTGCPRIFLKAISWHSDSRTILMVFQDKFGHFTAIFLQENYWWKMQGKLSGHKDILFLCEISDVLILVHRSEMKHIQWR